LHFEAQKAKKIIELSKCDRVFPVTLMWEHLRPEFLECRAEETVVEGNWFQCDVRRSPLDPIGDAIDRRERLLRMEGPDERVVAREPIPAVLDVGGRSSG
jgi:hypothetical protein